MPGQLMTSRRIWLRRAAAPFRGLEHHQTSGPVTRCPGLPGVVPAQWRGSPLQGSASFDKGSAQLTALTAAVFERTSITRAFPGSSLSHARRTDVVKKETEGRSGQHEGAPAQTREVQSGCVLTQAKNRCRRLSHPRSGFHHLCGCHRDRRASSANASVGKLGNGGGAAPKRKKVVMGDGSEWIWNQAQSHFPCPTQIVDLYHAREPLRSWLASCTPMVRPSRTGG